MIEFSLTEGQPLQRPWACVVCTGNLGLMCDTHRQIKLSEEIVWGNVYVCESCARLIARQFGWVRGKRATDLSNASKQIAQRDEMLRVQIEERDEWREKAMEMAALAEGLREELEIKTQRVEQLEGRFAEHAREALELAGVHHNGEEGE